MGILGNFTEKYPNTTSHKQHLRIITELPLKKASRRKK